MFLKNIVKFINEINSDIEVIIEKDLNKYGLACEPVEQVVYIGLRNTPDEENAFVNYVNELEPDFYNKFKINNLILSILHEVGHCFTHNEELEEEYNIDTELLNKMEENGYLTKRQQCDFYVRLELERLATQWAIDFCKNNLKFVKDFQEKIILKIS